MAAPGGIEQPVPVSQMRCAAFVTGGTVSGTLCKGQGGLAVLLSKAVSQLHSTVPSQWVCLTALCKVPILSQKPKASSFYSKVNLVADLR